MDLFECNEYINEIDILKINKFKNIFYENIKYPALFGRIRLKNETAIKSELRAFLNYLTGKVSELSEYIEYIDNLACLR